MNIHMLKVIPQQQTVNRPILKVDCHKQMEITLMLKEEVLMAPLISQKLLELDLTLRDWDVSQTVTEHMLKVKKLSLMRRPANAAPPTKATLPEAAMRAAVWPCVLATSAPAVTKSCCQATPASCRCCELVRTCQPKPLPTGRPPPPSIPSMFDSHWMSPTG